MSREQRILAYLILFVGSYWFTWLAGIIGFIVLEFFSAVDPGNREPQPTEKDGE